MEVTKHEQSLIHEVMLMAYEQGIEEGKKQAMKAMRDKVEAMKDRPRHIYDEDWRRP